jgi:hypothetical protein
MRQNLQEIIRKGHQAQCEGRLADSRAAFIDGVRRAAEDGDRTSLAEALCGLAEAEKGIGNLKAASLHYASAAVLYRQIGAKHPLADSLRHEAEVLWQMCQGQEAEPLYAEAEIIYRSLGDEAILDLNTLRRLGLIKQQMGATE